MSLSGKETGIMDRRGTVWRPSICPTPVDLTLIDDDDANDQKPRVELVPTCTVPGTNSMGYQLKISGAPEAMHRVGGVAGARTLADVIKQAIADDRVGPVAPPLGIAGKAIEKQQRNVSAEESRTKMKKALKLFLFTLRKGKASSARTAEINAFLRGARRST